MSGFFDYWGKAGAEGEGRVHLLPFHGFDVAAVGAEILDRDTALLPRMAHLSGFRAEDLRSAIPFVLALHDLGKFAEPFQDLMPDLVRELQGPRAARVCAVHHSSLGYQLWRSWATLRPAPDEAQLLCQLHQVELAGGARGHRDLGDLMQPWMAAVLGHHGKPPEEGTLGPGILQAHPAYRSRRDATAFALAARKLLAPAPLRGSEPDFEKQLQRMRRSSWWLAGFAILCDWIGSDTDFFQPQRTEMDLAEYWQRARTSAARAVEHSGLGRSTPRAYAGVEHLFPQIAASPSPLQGAAATIEIGDGPQFYVLEDLTGSGKTEAALILAHRLLDAGRSDGIFFALPTMATANAMHRRVEPLLNKLFKGEPSYLLTHSGPRLTCKDRIALGQRSADDAAGEEEAAATASAWLADGRKKALLAELGVGTIDQALLAALQSKHAAFRLLGLHRHVLVVDEVHACDVYMLRVLCGLLRAHAGLGGSAILLSATLPLEQRRQLARAFAEGAGAHGAELPTSEEYPLLTAWSGDRVQERAVAARNGAPRTLPIVFRRSVAEVVARLTEAARAGRCACWVRNSVADAVEARDLLAAILGEDAVTLFHARFALGDRLRIEDAVLARFGTGGEAAQRCGRVVIATQVIEQSLDVDFDVLVSDLCPIDRLIQRAGRLQRHARADLDRDPPALEVLAPPWSEDPSAGWLSAPFQRTAVVYPDPAVLWRTLRELKNRQQFALPGEARALVEAVFGSDETPAALMPRSGQAVGKQLSQASVAQGAVLCLDLGYLRQGMDWSSEAHTPTRLGEPTVTVRLARAEAAAPWLDGVARHLQWPLSQLSVTRRLVARPSPDEADLVAQLERTQPFVGDDIVTVPLRLQGDGTWTGRAVAERGPPENPREVPVQILYSPVRGLSVIQGA
ncbi:CRISPR-associated helicase Cas3' [Anaeromyxobacter paludicola]|uniref:CRISPR-associated helicase/endonuclease Cas3 n=1 Tax=Anaeromyxobacter paludicola TaxID=2918171 RepID=A0ABN6NCH7_9BACT|nr:CRISPR-associated helicase Cas3' [Anaeromyxobacter paludicola]BDG10090.1 CRISPR-associated helicase/endonuclease Cas3 [Anaeromyxobacter paludicola]